MAMEVKKVNELEENNKVSKLVGMDSAGNMFSGDIGIIMRRGMYSYHSGKGSAWISKIVGIFEIKTSKGTAIFICTNYGDDYGVILGDTQHYTKNEQDAIDNKKILIHRESGGSYTEFIDHTGEDLTIRVSAIGLDDASFNE